MSFSKLPNELVSRVISYLPPDDLRKAAVTSKLVYGLSKHFLDLARNWSYVQLGTGHDVSAPYGAQWAFPTAAKFLDEVIRTPQIAQYVTYISTSVEWDEGFLEQKENEERSEHARELAQAHDDFQQILEGSCIYITHNCDRSDFEHIAPAAVRNFSSRD